MKDVRELACDELDLVSGGGTSVVTMTVTNVETPKGTLQMYTKTENGVTISSAEWFPK